MLGGQLFDAGLSGFSQNDGKASLQLCIMLKEARLGPNGLVSC